MRQTDVCIYIEREAKRKEEEEGISDTQVRGSEVADAQGRGNRCEGEGAGEGVEG